MEAYAYYKSKYYSAANQKRTSERQERAYISERNAAQNQMNSLLGRRWNLDRRLQCIEDIIKILEVSGGWLSADVPGAIGKAQRSLSRTNDSFRKSMQLSGGAGAADLETALKPKTVDADAHASSALAAFKAERNRLKQEIAELHTQITNASSRITSLKNKIKACNATQASLQSAMNSYAYDMNHYRKYTY